MVENLVFPYYKPLDKSMSNTMHCNMVLFRQHASKGRGRLFLRQVATKIKKQKKDKKKNYFILFLNGVTKAAREQGERQVVLETTCQQAAAMRFYYKTGWTEVE